MDAQPMDDRLIRKSEHAVNLSVFEGPLDLLLFLIRRNEIDIYDIPIQSVLVQYLDVLRKMETLDLEVAGDFFVMASTLMYIKSRMLLPQEKRGAEEEIVDEEAIDPRWELVQQLLEYRKIKEAAADRTALIDEAQHLLPRLGGGEAIEPARPLRPADRVDVWNAFNRVLRRLSERLSVGEIEAETVTVADRMELVLERLERERSFLFSSLIEPGAGRQTLVATFLALLELARLNRIALEQEDNFSDIRCERAEPTVSPPEMSEPEASAETEDGH